VMAST